MRVVTEMRYRCGMLKKQSVESPEVARCEVCGKKMGGRVVKRTCSVKCRVKKYRKARAVRKMAPVKVDVERWKERALELAVCESSEEGYRAVIPGVKGCTGEGPRPGVAMSRLIEGLDGWVEMVLERGLALPVLTVRG